MSNKRALLIIMDGWGHGRKDESNAIHLADTPFIDSLYNSVPNAELRTDGEFVGLPEGQMGNSEVGHLNIGAGRVVYQDLAKINKAVDDNSFFENKALLEAIGYAKENNVRCHIMGLVSDGGIHSSTTHLNAIIDACEKNQLEEFYVHAFTDGRDTDPDSGVDYIQKLDSKLSQGKGQLASIVGRYYAMDRDKRWERIKEAYDLLKNGIGIKSTNAVKAIQTQYDNEIGDEFLKPICMTDESGNPLGQVKSGDVVICFNFRTDRCRQITSVLTQTDLPEFNMATMPLQYFTMTRYDESFEKIGVLFEKENLKLTLGEVVANASKTQVRMAETEKYPHVTFFFSGGREKEFIGEKRVMANSPKVATYDLQPEMSALELAKKAIAHLSEHLPDLAIVNFANPDMVGHTGIVKAIIKAVETTDSVTKQLSEFAQSLGYETLIIADHGNAELNINEDGGPHTSHTTNPVPVFYLGSRFTEISDGKLADIAPSLLAIMGVDQPSEMTGNSLLD